MGMELKGEREVQKEIDRLRKEVPDALGAALYSMALDPVIRKAKRKTPVDTGFLRGSFYAAPPEKSADGDVFVRLGNGANYAIYVHERTDQAHDEGEAKFLMKAIDEASSDFAPELAKRTQKYAESGIGIAIGEGAPTTEAGGRRQGRAEARARAEQNGD